MLINRPIKLEIYFSFSFTYDRVYVSMMYGVLMPLPVCGGERTPRWKEGPLSPSTSQGASTTGTFTCSAILPFFLPPSKRYISVHDMYGELS